MWQFTVIDVFCHRVIEQGLDLDEIQTLAQKHATMLEKWEPKTMRDVEVRARTYKLCVRMKNWIKQAPTADD